MSALIPRFFQVEHSLVKFLGCHVRAVVYSRLQQWQEYAQAQEWSVDKETGLASFFRIGNDLSTETVVPERTLARILSEFKANGWLKIERRGFDPKVWYTFLGAAELSENQTTPPPKWPRPSSQNGAQPVATVATAHQPKWRMDLTINKEIKKEIKEDLCEPPPLGASSPPKIKKSSVAKIPKTQKPKSESSEVWDVYASGFQKRYATAPIRNARVNTQLSQFASAVGLKTALRIASWYVSRSDSFLVSKCHPLGLMISDAQKWDVESQQKRAITKFDAKAIELYEHNVQVFNDVRSMNDLDLNPFDIFDVPTGPKKELLA